jgi:hypothetical protein
MDMWTRFCGVPRYKKGSNTSNPYEGCTYGLYRFNAEQCSHACMYSYICNAISSPYKETQGYMITRPNGTVNCPETLQVSRNTLNESYCSVTPIF